MPCQVPGFTVITVYGYAKCSTCRDALKWLDARGIGYREKAIRETPPSECELRFALGHLGRMGKLFNTSGMDYRAMGLAAKLPGMSEAEAIRLLAGNGNLVKRPLVIGGDFALAGFREAEWKAALCG
jgi:arsenate reductase (glutaredoxin)